MTNQRRRYKVAEKIREIVAQEFVYTADPRLSLITITSVVVSPDLREAKIYWNVFGPKERIAEVKEAFKSAAGMFRKKLARGLKTKFVPRLSFFYDDTLDTCEEVEELFKKIEG